MSVNNKTQASSVASEIMSQLKSHNASCISQEGLDTGEWILLDFGDVIIHIFQESSRDIYDLDTLWGNFPTAPIPPEYYISSNIIDPKNEMTNKMKNYF